MTPEQIQTIEESVKTKIQALVYTGLEILDINSKYDSDAKVLTIHLVMPELFVANLNLINERRAFYGDLADIEMDIAQEFTIVSDDIFIQPEYK